MGLVLREYDYLSKSRVDEIGYGEVNKAVLTAKGHSGLGSVGGERHQALALSAGENDSENLGGSRHAPRLCPSPHVY